MANKFKWLNIPEVQTLLTVLNKVPNHSFKFVGGCVRDSLINLTPKDFDLASNITPLQNIINLQQHGIKTVTNAKEYGTVTAIINQQPFEITSLRKDIKTFGRAAEVIFSNSFKEDAARRDFTFNALYLCPFSLQIDDYFNGIADLAAGNVKFIGNIGNRITEDYLRILRYIRFYTIYGKQQAEADDLSTIKLYGEKLQLLSRERIISELNKILAANNVVKGITLINSLELSQYLFKQASLNITNLINLLALEQQYFNSPNYLLRLLCLVNNYNNIADLYKQREHKNYLQQFNKLQSFLANYPSYNEVLTSFKPLLVKEFCVLQLSGNTNNPYYLNLLEFTIKHEKFKLPISGDDLIKLGVKSGKQIGDLLHQLLLWGLTKSNPSKADYMVYLSTLLNKKTGS